MTWHKMVVAFAVLATGIGNALSQPAAYPSKPVTLIVPVATGSSTDLFARFFAEQLGKKLNQSFVVENTPGAGGTLGVQKLLSRPADGYNVLIGTSSTNAANFSLYKTLPYTLDDMAPVACLYLLPQVIAVRTDLPVKTVAELVAYSKTNPGQLTYGWGSSVSKIGAETFKARTGANIRDIPYKGSQQVVADMLGGRIDMTAESAVVILPHAQRGTLRILAVLSPTRLSSLPDAPTMEELGFRNATTTPWVAAFAKSGTPKDVIEKLNAAFGTVLASPEYAVMEGRAMSKSFACSPQELGAFSQKELQQWSELIKAAGIEKE